MSGRGVVERSKWREPRGPGRPPIDPDGETESVRVRLAQSHRTELDSLIAQGHGDGLGGAIRYLIDESAKRHRDA